MTRDLCARLYIVGGYNKQSVNCVNCKRFLTIGRYHDKPSFTNDDSQQRILYLASKNIVSHWSAACRNWDLVSNKLSIMFADRENA